MSPFKTIEEYEEYIKTVHVGKKYSKKEVEELSPDNIDNHIFWAELYEKFGPYIFSPSNNKNSSVEETIVKSNLLANSINALQDINTHLFINFNCPKRILEIGPGYGNFYHYLQKFSYGTFNYKCFDMFYADKCIIPKINRINIFEGQNDASFDLIYCINVLQHFSYQQLITYFNLFYKLLDKGRLQISYYTNGSQNGEDGKSYVYHFGQLTEAIKQQEMYQLLSDIGFLVINRTMRHDGLESLSLQKMEKK